MTASPPALRAFERPFKRAVPGLLRLLFAPRRRKVDLSRAFRRILVIRQHNQLGDMLCVVPLLRALRTRYPDARVTLMTSPVNHAVMEGNRYIDATLLYDKREFLLRGRLHPVRLLRFVRSLRALHADLVLVPATVSTSFTSDLFALLSGATVRIGPARLAGEENPSGVFYTVGKDLVWPADRHQTLRNLDIAAGLLTPPEDISLEMTLTDEERREGRRVIGDVAPSGEAVVALHPGAGKVPNRWPAARFAEVASALAGERKVRFIVTVGPMDEEPWKELESRLSIPVYLVKNESIRRVASILSAVHLVISNDTGVMHVAAAVGAPVLSLFGPTDPRQWAPQGEKNRYIQGEGGDITRISTAGVLSAARRMLDAGESDVDHISEETKGRRRRQ